MKRFFTPTIRISLGLVSLMLSLLLAANFFGILPDRAESNLDARKKVVESLAVQLSWGAGRNDLRMINSTLESVVTRNEDITSAGLRKISGELVAEAGKHSILWEPPPEDRSTATQVQVPIFYDEKRWGTVEIAFAPLTAYSGVALLKNSFMGLLIFSSLAGFVAFFFFLRRALRELDPASVIPDRVKSAFDALAEGVMVMDEDERIVLVNKSFADKVGQAADKLIGQKASALDWRLSRSGEALQAFPWKAAIETKVTQTGVPMPLRNKSGTVRNFMVNGAPILDGKGNSRGALATFDDVTDVEKKNHELQLTLRNLEAAKKDVNRKNKELKFLAMRDPMTGCLNRRSFLDRFDTMFAETLKDGGDLSCIMVDIDHFKSINDKFGHTVGDKVITAVADVLKANARDCDLVCRYGGEEFCIVLPGLNLSDSSDIAERHRTAIISQIASRMSEEITVTASLGVAAFKPSTKSPAELINEADMALYSAKESGRNRVIRFGSHTPAAAEQVVRLSDTAGDPELELARAFARVAELEARIEVLSAGSEKAKGYDELTGLPNRLLFFDRVEQAIAVARRDEGIVALLYLDIDLFDRVNDVLGPVVGDNLLQGVAERMTNVFRQSDTVGLIADGSDQPMLSRMATDEFSVVLTGIDDTNSLTWIVQRLFDALTKPIQIDDHEIYVTASVGISMYPDDGGNAQDLVKHAGAARQHAKQKLGCNNFVFFAPEMNERALEQMNLESKLRRAIEFDELSLHYQPIWDLATANIVSFETLLRWENPELGFVSPDVFIPIAEHGGFIREIGDWVLKHACRQARKWVDAGNDNVCVSINISALQFRGSGFVEDLAVLLHDAGITPRNVEIEITETALIRNIDRALELLDGLRKIGVCTALDDFGTGYSSLGYLKKLATDRLKIDRTFVANVATDKDDAALVAAIIAMGHRMGMKVVAEGVETEQQVKILRKLKCDHVQGYFLGRPVPVEAATSLLESVQNRDGTHQVLLENMLENKSSQSEARETELTGA